MELWKKANVEDILQKRWKLAKTKQPFILHDGPPYANGHLHLGHAINKIAKDTAVRTARLHAFQSPFIPGWDCHGLPIEAKVEEDYKKKGIDKKTVSPLEFRQACRRFATHWIETQRNEFLRMGLSGSFDTPYRTMDKFSEASIVRGLLTLLEKGLIYRGLKPVFWSPTEETALAEAEVEYQEIISPSIYVGFPLSNVNTNADLKGVSALIWTTTPWTLPANRAVAYSTDLAYAIVRFQGKKRYLIAKKCIANIEKETGLHATIEKVVQPQELSGLMLAHPLYEQGYNFDVPFVPGSHVTADAGSGLVHTAPAHGIEDFSLAAPFNLEVTDLITPAGIFKKNVPLVHDWHVYKAKEPILKALEASGNLFYQSTVQHSYPHSWRSKAPLIYRATSQWFMALDSAFGLRKKAVSILKNVKFFPETGRARLTSMLENRPDWCLSRQRRWGIPLMLFMNKEGQPLKDKALNEAVVKLVEQEGSDVWWTNAPEALLKGHGYHATDYTKVLDILDVWFESGMTHQFVLDKEERPVDVYWEGSDQHRGWFQSSLLLSTALENKSPTDAFVTHGFVVDSKGKKMSKSQGNTFSPADIIKKYGADILRLWSLSSDMREDIRISSTHFDHAIERYRKFRNTFRFLLGNLEDIPSENCCYLETSKNLPALEQWVLAKLQSIEKPFQDSLNAFRFDKTLQIIHTFCSQDLSSFYFDVRKDTLYCDAKKTPLRMAVQSTLATLLHTLTTWLAPFLPFTAENVYQVAIAENKWPLASPPAENLPSIHLEHVQRINQRFQNKALLTKMERLREIRSMVTNALETKRSSGTLGTSLEAHVQLNIADEPTYRLLNNYGEQNFADLCLVSVAHFHFTQTAPQHSTTIEVTISLSKDKKCPRCWRFIVPSTQRSPLCHRCQDAEENDQ